MEWLLVSAVVVVCLIFRGRRQRRAEEAARQFLQAPARSIPSESTSPEPMPKPWADPRRNAEHKFTEESNQWERTSGFGRRANFEPVRGKGETARWIPRGEAVRVAGISIESGMFYIGSSFAGRRGAENCLVDPACKVASSGSDREGRSLPYWPSYSSISPVARRTFLEWLANGRDDPDIGIGYVFIFFYGLERRLFVDGDKDEAGALLEEVRRLLATYGGNNSFRSYASKFIDAAALARGPDIYRPALSPELRNGYELPMAVRLHLGRKLAAKESFDSTDALLWTISLPDTYLRTPATRCFEELVELWHLRFAARYPDGLKVNPPKTRLKLDYHAASGGFECRIDLSDKTGPLPDIAAISAPLDGLRDILNSCTEELASYSRLIGKKPESKGTIDAAFLLPKELLTSPVVVGTSVMRKIEDLFEGRNIAGVECSRLMKALGLSTDTGKKLPAGLCNQIGSFLDKLDVGFEPDRRYGSRNLEADSYVLLFKAAGGAPVNGDAPAFASGRAVVEVAALAACADGKVEASEFESIKADIRALPGLSGMERGRLMVYMSTLLKDVSAQRAALQKVRHVGQGARESVVRSAMSAILADGHAGPDEVKFLERLYKTLGLPVEDVYSALHSGAVVVDEPVSVMPESRADGLRIPAGPQATKPGFQIDKERLERIRNETSAVSDLLAGIFVEDQPAVPPPVPVQERASVHAQSFPGLNAAHAEIVSKLLTVESLERTEFEEMARGLRLLPDGAIETINDWGFDRFDEPLIEGDDPVGIVKHLRAELQGAVAAE